MSCVWWRDGERATWFFRDSSLVVAAASVDWKVDRLSRYWNEIALSATGINDEPSRPKAREEEEIRKY